MQIIRDGFDLRVGRSAALVIPGRWDCKRVTFGMTPGILPFAASRPAPLFAPLLRRSAQN
jgi:hypothetical protein